MKYIFCKTWCTKIGGGKRASNLTFLPLCTFIHAKVIHVLYIITNKYSLNCTIHSHMIIYDAQLTLYVGRPLHRTWFPIGALSSPQTGWCSEVAANMSETQIYTCRQVTHVYDTHSKREKTEYFFKYLSCNINLLTFRFLMRTVFIMYIFCLYNIKHWSYFSLFNLLASVQFLLNLRNCLVHWCPHNLCVNINQIYNCYKMNLRIHFSFKRKSFWKNVTI